MNLTAAGGEDKHGVNIVESMDCRTAHTAGMPPVQEDGPGEERKEGEEERKPEHTSTHTHSQAQTLLSSACTYKLIFFMRFAGRFSAS